MLRRRKREVVTLLTLVRLFHRSNLRSKPRLAVLVLVATFAEVIDGPAVPPELSVKLRSGFGEVIGRRPVVETGVGGANGRHCLVWRTRELAA